MRRSGSRKSCEIGDFKPEQIVFDLNRPHGCWEGPIFSYADSKESGVVDGRLTSELS